jgi:hypothetical protein
MNLHRVGAHVSPVVSKITAHLHLHHLDANPLARTDPMEQRRFPASPFASYWQKALWQKEWPGR